jgi:hypothetical protein
LPLLIGSFISSNYLSHDHEPISVKDGVDDSPIPLPDTVRSVRQFLDALTKRAARMMLHCAHNVSDAAVLRVLHAGQGFIGLIV